MLFIFCDVAAGTTYKKMTVIISERPKAVLKVSPDGRVFRGERVTLTCDIQRAGHIQWTYSWFKDGNHFYPTTTEISFTADVYKGGEYSCRGERSDSQRSHTSAAVTLTVSDKPKPTLTVKPQSSVFTGDRVTLSCDVGQLTGSTILWRKDSNPESTSDETKTIESVSVSDEGEYWCRAQRGNYYSEFSNTVKITVKERPKPVVDVDPDRRVFRGETVTLTCHIQQTGVWQYSWYKDRKQDYIIGPDQNYKISSVDSSHSGVYSCRGTQTQAPAHTQMSDGVTLTVSDSPRSTLTVTPDSAVFTGETVTLKCVIETHSDWRYEWYKDSVMLQSSDRYTVNRDTLTIRVTTSDQGLYWCRGQIRSVSSLSSSAVSLSVKDLPRSTLTVTPDSPVFTGETVTLKCVIESDYSNWRYEWYKDSVISQSSDRYTVNRDTLSIKALNESDQDQYWCRGQRDERPNSSQESNRIHLSANASSSLLVTAVVVGSSVCLLIFISLLLLWRYKKNKDQQRNINQTSVPNQSAESQPENSPLQSGRLGERRTADSDQICDVVTEVKKRDKGDPEPLADVTYSEITVKKNKKKMDKDDTKAEPNDVTYSEVRNKVKKSRSNGPSDLVYAQIDLQDKKKTKGKGKSSESGDTLYSELKHNTDRDADAGDETYAQPMRKKNKTRP